MNLLPEKYKKELMFEAWGRFIIFFGGYSTAIGIIGIMLLLPSFFFLSLQITREEERLTRIQNGTSYKKTITGEKEIIV